MVNDKLAEVLEKEVYDTILHSTSHEQAAEQITGFFLSYFQTWIPISETEGLEEGEYVVMDKDGYFQIDLYKNSEWYFYPNITTHYLPLQIKPLKKEEQ